jgi:hypothetical protein
MSVRHCAQAAVVTVGLASWAAAPAEAATLPLVGNQTEVEVTAPLAALGLGGAPFGTATVDVSGANPIFTFPVTGGTLDTASGDARVEHQGSGVTLSALADPTVSATVGNFFIDTIALQVSGDVLGGASGVPFFDLGAATTSGVELFITAELAGALTGVFGADNLTGAQFGFARPDLAPIPLPAGVWLMIAGLAAFGAVRARGRRAA